MNRLAPLAATIMLTSILSSCGKSTSELGGSSAYADPTTTSSAEQLFPADKIDSLPLSMDEVNKFADAQFNGNLVAPAHKPSEDRARSCELFSNGAPGSVQIFQKPWGAFLQVQYAGYSNVSFSQSIAVYDSYPLASNAFEEWSSFARRCSGSEGHSGIRETRDSVTWEEDPTSAGKECSSEVRIVRNVLVQVEACLYENSGEITRLATHSLILKVN